MSEPTTIRTSETGDPRVDDALRGVDDLDGVPVDEHAERLSAAHGVLQEVLRTPADPVADARSVVPRPR